MSDLAIETQSLQKHYRSIHPAGLTYDARSSRLDLWLSWPERRGEKSLPSAF
jgi:hypothetical protein